MPLIVLATANTVLNHELHVNSFVRGKIFSSWTVWQNVGRNIM